MSAEAMRVIRAGDCKRMPWKNGGGSTTELAVFPDGALWNRRMTKSSSQ